MASITRTDLVGIVVGATPTLISGCTSNPTIPRTPQANRVTFPVHDLAATLYVLSVNSPQVPTIANMQTAGTSFAASNQAVVISEISAAEDVYAMTNGGTFTVYRQESQGDI